MAKTSSLYVRIDPDIKTSVEKIYRQYGMSITDAINVFLYTTVKYNGLPFDLRDPMLNEETIEALEEVKLMKQGELQTRGYSTFDEMIGDL